MKLGEIVDDSIIENKEKTKCYWEQLMAANSEANNVSPTSRKQLQLALDTADSPKIVETVAKKLMQSNDNPPRIRSSVIEKEIQMQKERELAFAREREETRSKLQDKSPKGTDSGNEHDGSHRVTDQDEVLALSIPTTDDGNYSEYGSEDKEDHDTSVTCHTVPHHQRTRSLDSMSSGHSSASGSGCGSSGETGYSRRRQVTVKPLDGPDEKNSSEFIRNEKETPIEREIRLSREREDELRREKLSLSSRGRPVTASCKPTKSKQENTDKAVIVEKRSTLPSDASKLSATVVTDVLGIHRRRKSLTSEPLQNSAKGAVPKLFSPNPNQKGLMKRFIASRGKLTPTFALPSHPINVGVEKKIPVENNVAPLDRPLWVSTRVSNIGIQQVAPEKRDTTLLGTRPGYVSAEDKIQVELKEMRKREEELRRQQLARSQPDLLCMLEQEEQNSTEDRRSNLRSTLSNPNLLDLNEKPTSNEKNKPAIRRSALIDVWENMIQKN